MGSWEMHLSAILACLPLCATAGHPNYLKSARFYLQKMHTLEDENPEVHHNFQSGFHVIRGSSQYWAGLGSDRVIEQREREMFYLMTHSTHFIYGYMASDI